MLVTQRKNNSTGLEVKDLPLPTVLERGLSATKSKLGTQSRTYLDKEGTTSQKRVKLSRSERLQRKKQTKAQVVDLLHLVGEKDLAEKVNICGQKFDVLHDRKSVIRRQPLHRCDFRLCPFCAGRRSRKLIEKYLVRARDFVKFGGIKVEPVHLTLTQAHREGETLKDCRQRLMLSFRKLIRRKVWTEHFAGGLYSLEFTLSDQGEWHCHLHILAFRRRFFDISMLKLVWKEITGDSHVLRLDRLTDFQAVLFEVLKYLSKPADLAKFGRREISEFLTLRGQKMVGVFGEFADFCKDYEEKFPSDNDEILNLSEGDICPCGCGETLVREVMTIEDLILFTRKGERIKKE